MGVGPEDPVRRVMHGDVVSIDLGASLREIAERMVDEEVGSVVIVEMGQTVGIVTQRDLVMAMADGSDPHEVTAGDVMSEQPLCADPDDSVRFAAERMIQAGVLHIPVLQGGKPIGMVSVRDMFKAVAESREWIAPMSAV